MDYKSPIEITIGQFRWEQEKRIEGEVFSAIQEVGINVYREELVKALQYDRDQYYKGYKDGVKAKADTVKAFAERLKEARVNVSIPLLGLHTKSEIEDYVNELFEQIRDEIDQIAKEMLEGENNNGTIY